MKKSAPALSALLGIVCTSLPGLASAQLLHSFAPPEGTSPQGGLVRDAAGALYGTTYNSGPSQQAHPSGTVYELSPPAVGSQTWTEHLLYAFPTAKADGENPVGSLTPSSSGTLYGATHTGIGAAAYGIIFELHPPADGVGPWTETILHTFNNTDGAEPAGDLVIDQSGALYGITLYGGPYKLGTVFKLNPPGAGGGKWTLQTLHAFGQPLEVGSIPIGRLARDAAGNLYGATESGGGGVVSYGTVFELSPPAVGQTDWTETVVYNFADQPAGQTPQAGLAIDAAGVLYGTTAYGGTGTQCRAGCGTVFTLVPPASGAGGIWAHQVVYSFQGPEGSLPAAAPVLDKAGNVYGTTQTGGNKAQFCFDSGCGSIYKLAPPPTVGGSWTITTYVPPDPTQGSGPIAGLLLSPDGWAYGTAPYGGDPLQQSYGAGTVFRLRQ